MIGVAYQHLPPPVELVHVLSWKDGRAPVELQPPARVSSGSIVVLIECTSDADVVVAFARKDGAALLDGPFACPPINVERRLDSTWRRTLRIRAPPESSAHADVSWVSATPENPDRWPRCGWTGATAECWGSAVDARGLLVFVDADRVWWTVVAAGMPVADFHSSAWARLIVVRDDAGGRLAATIAYPVMTAERRTSVRLDTALVADAHAASIATGVAWVYGERIPLSAWIELRVPGAGPTYLSLEEIAHGPPALPLWVTLETARTLDGIARSPQGVAAGSVVTLFRLIDLPSRQDSRQQPRRVFAEEKVAGAAGEFRFEALGDADYEIVAWHPQFGRGIVAVARRETSASVRLESTGQVRGRVIAGGKPIAGVDVISLPDPDAFAQAADLTDVKGGDGRTGADGRFVVSLAPGGGGEVRVGGGSYPIRRFPLPRVAVPAVDLGDIDLGSPIEVTLTLDRDSACTIRATGPIGRSGLQVISGARTGPGLFRIAFPEEGMWEVHLLCGRDERSLVPAVVFITQANSGKELRLMVR